MYKQIYTRVYIQLYILYGVYYVYNRCDEKFIKQLERIFQVCRVRPVHNIYIHILDGFLSINSSFIICLYHGFVRVLIYGKCIFTIRLYFPILRFMYIS